MEIIREAFLPVFTELDEKKVDPRSLAMFMAHYVNELLKDIGDDIQRENILRRMLDW